MSINWKLEADVDGDGVFEADWTPYLLSVRTGFGHQDALAALSPRTLTVQLSNEDSRFSPRNRNSPYWPHLKLGTEVRLLASLPAITDVRNLIENPSLELDIRGWSPTGPSTLTWEVREVVDDFISDTSPYYTAGGDAPGNWVWQTSNSRLSVSGGTHATLLRNDLSITNAAVDVVMSTANDAGVIARWQSNSNYYLLAIRDDRIAQQQGLANLEIFKRIAGVFTSLGVADVVWKPGDTHHIRFEVSGSNLKAYFDGDLKISVVDTAIAGAGRVGLRKNTVSGGLLDFFEQVEFSNLDVTSTKAYYGRASLRVTGGVAAGAIATRINGTRIAVVAGQSYVWAPRLMFASGTLRLSLQWYDSAGTLISGDNSASISPAGDGVWIWPSLVSVAPPGAVTVSPIVLRTSGSGNFWVDGGFFYQGSALQPYVDGDQPLAAWLGAPHGSQSERLAADVQNILLFRGSLQRLTIPPRRQGQEPTIRMEFASELGLAGRKRLSLGPFTRKPADLVANRIVDLLEAGEIIKDGADRTNGAEGETYSNRNSTSGGIIIVSAEQTFPAAYPAMESDYVRAQGNIATGSVWEITVTDRTTVNVPYVVTGFFTTRYLANNGKSLGISLVDHTGIRAETIVTLETGTYVYFVLEGTFVAGNRRIRCRALGPLQNALWDDIYWDCIHMVPKANRIPRRIEGLDYPIEFFTAFQRNASAALTEFANSVGAYLHSEPDGTIVIEEINRVRSPATVPALRLSDYFDGYGVGDLTVDLDGSNAVTEVRVNSSGELTPLSLLERQKVWSLEPVPRTLAADEEVTYSVDYATEGGGSIARVERVTVTLSGGSLATSYPILRPYSTAAELVLKAGTTGATISEAIITGRIQQRSESERAFVSYRPPGVSAARESVEELDMPGQGNRTPLMRRTAQWAGDKYGKAPPRISLRLLEGAVDTATASGITGWQRLLAMVAATVGTPVWVKHTLGTGALGLDGLYFVESWELTKDPGTPAMARLILEEA